MRFDKWNILSFCFMWQVFKSLLDYCFHTCLSVNTLNNSKVTTESGNCFTQYPWKYPYLRVLSPGCIRFFLLEQSSPHPYRIISSLFKMLLSPFSTPPPLPHPTVNLLMILHMYQWVKEDAHKASGPIVQAGASSPWFLVVWSNYCGSISTSPWIRGANTLKGYLSTKFDSTHLYT